MNVTPFFPRGEIIAADVILRDKVDTDRNVPSSE